MDIGHVSNAELRAIATRALANCCDECRAVLREQLEREESCISTDSAVSFPES